MQFKYIPPVVLFSIFFLLWSVSLTAQTIEGTWLTIDPRNNKPLSEIHIYKVNNKYYGRLTKLYQHPPNNPNPVCTQCSGYNKNKPWIGLIILNDFQKNGKVYENGTLLIPKYGVSLPCKLYFDESNPDVISIEGRVGFIKRTSSWSRVKSKSH